MPESSRKPGLTFAVIDDDPSIRKALQRFLRSEGWQVLVSESAESFMAGNDIRGIHCMILDIRLPGLSGPEFRRSLHDRGVNIPTVFITGHRTDAPAHRFEESADAALLRKPFEAAHLLRAISQVTGAGAATV